MSSNGLLIDGVRFGARLFTQLYYSHIKKERNKVTYNLARCALCISYFVVWMEDVPPHFLSDFPADLVGFS